MPNKKLMKEFFFHWMIFSKLFDALFIHICFINKFIFILNSYSHLYESSYIFHLLHSLHYAVNKDINVKIKGLQQICCIDKIGREYLFNVHTHSPSLPLQLNATQTQSLPWVCLLDGFHFNRKIFLVFW